MSGTRPRRTQEERRDESEQRMLAAGLRLVAEQGIEKLTLADVGKTAGYSRGLPAHHFGSKEQYLKALASYATIEFEKTVPIEDRLSGLPALLELIRTVFVHLTADPTRLLLTQVVLRDPRKEQALSGEVGALRDKTLATLAQHVRTGIAAGQIRASVDPEMASLFLAASICGVVETWMANPDFDVAAAGTQLIELTRHALEQGKSP
ncbi:TetR family transcriptional regulator [Archangium minus]|uniref:TetR family transcriptional regulator n=1 Tax=Archangium minus TaxID=83450 RepID=A0ABY9WT01_9BACT|nr:TetR family transcriptional regulator [Archangium violaceum]WNG46921.1 TetR family transcriptional regulator [Archangium minus]